MATSCVIHVRPTNIFELEAIQALPCGCWQPTTGLRLWRLGWLPSRPKDHTARLPATPATGFCISRILLSWKEKRTGKGIDSDTTVTTAVGRGPASVSGWPLGRVGWSETFSPSPGAVLSLPASPSDQDSRTDRLAVASVGHPSYPVRATLFASNLEVLRAC